MADLDPQTPSPVESLTTDRRFRRLRTNDPGELAEWLVPMAGSLRLVPRRSRFRVDVRASRLGRTGLFEIQHDDLRVLSPQRDYWSLTIALGRPLRLIPTHIF